MPASLADQKAALRRRLRDTRAATDPADRSGWSAAITERVLAHAAVQTATTVHAFVGSLPGEVDTAPLLQRLLHTGTRLVCPRVEGEALAHYVVDDLDALADGLMGLREPDPRRCAPADVATIDVVLTPGLAFDRAGRRLGMGRAYYDRFLATLSAMTSATAASATTIGLAFEIQVVDQVPVAEHDVPVDWLITQDRTIDCRSGRAEEPA